MASVGFPFMSWEYSRNESGGCARARAQRRALRPGVGLDSGRPPGSLRQAPPRTKSVTYVLGIKCYL